MSNNILQSCGRALERILKYLNKKRKYHYRVPLLTKIKYAALGFNPDEYVYYNLDTNNYKEYLTDYELVRSWRWYTDVAFVLHSKLLFEEIAEKYAKVPTNYAYIKNGNIYGLKNYDINNENIINFIKSINICILKPDQGSCGVGFYLIKHIENDKFEINGKISSSQELLDIICKSSEESILTEYMYQSEFSASLYPNSTNTIRIVLARKKTERDFHIIAASQRIGTDASKPVDNYAAGGLACSINLETGELGYARREIACDIEHCHKKYETHPDTGVQIKGRVIPNWEKLKEDVLAFTYKFPYLNFLAWDILLTEDGFCVIEGNESSCLKLLQIEKGMRFEALGDIFRSYGINGVNDISKKS